MSLRLSRRDLLKIGGLGLATSLLGQRADAAALFGRMFAVPPRDTTYFTPNDKFYVVNYSDSPFSLSRDVRIDQWRLSISGAVKLPMALSYGDILQRPAIDRAVTLECIDNLPGGDSMGNAMWRGLSLKALLEEVGAEKEAPFELPLSPYTWVIWYYNWAPPKAGSYQVTVRAIDAKGLLQTAEIVRPSPAGASGLHTVVTVVDRL